VGRRSKRRLIPLLFIGAGASLAASYAIAATGGKPASSPGASAARAQAVRVAPSSLVVRAGATAQYSIRLTRGRINRTRLSVLGWLPARASTSFTTLTRRKHHHRRRRSWALLNVSTDLETRPGTYVFQVQAQRRSKRISGTGTIIVIGPSASASAPVIPPVVIPDTFSIAGNLAAELIPGSGEPLDLSLTNNGDADLRVASLDVTVASVSAPAADSSHPCTPGDFAVDQFSGSYGFTLPSLSTTSFSDLGISATEWPNVSMLNLPANQDGCQGATLSLAYSGTATGGNP